MGGAFTSLSALALVIVTGFAGLDGTGLGENAGADDAYMRHSSGPCDPSGSLIDFVWCLIDPELISARSIHPLHGTTR